MNTKVANYFFMTQQVVPQMKKQNCGDVVNISAVLADEPSRSVRALLAVQNATFVTGENIRVDGGVHAGR